MGAILFGIELLQLKKPWSTRYWREQSPVVLCEVIQRPARFNSCGVDGLLVTEYANDESSSG